MENKIIIGIDPSATHGGIAVLNDFGDLIELATMPPTPMDIYQFFKEVHDNASVDNKEVVAYLEDVGYGRPNQGVKSIAMFARHNGHLEMALLALGIKTVKVLPTRWEKTYSLGKSSDYSKTEWKNRLKAKAQQLFPSQKITLATSDALLIAEYGRKQEK